MCEFIAKYKKSFRGRTHLWGIRGTRLANGPVNVLRMGQTRTLEKGTIRSATHRIPR
jgi:hypothetical protein